jgi:glucosamine--fructose-6-phosphate aminotransferase (isomerizing)
MNGQYTYTEIGTQGDVWQETLAAFVGLEGDLRRAWTAVSPKQLIFIGCGSTHYLSQTAAALFQSLTGVAARAYPASELILFPEQVLGDAESSLLVAVSRSGTTTETLTAVNKFRQQGGTAVWTITCYPHSPLGQAADLVLSAQAAQEESVAQTRSFTSMLLLAQAMAASLGGLDLAPLHRLPDMAHVLIAQAEPLAAELGRNMEMERLYFLGSGFQFGVAGEAMLKMTEMSLTPSQSFHVMEYRHGPMSMATEEALVVGLLSPAVFPHEHQVLLEMGELGAHTLALNPTTAVTGAEFHVNLPSDLPDWAYPVLYLPPLQLLAYYRSLAKGLDPDNPPHITAVIYLDTAVIE